MGRVSDRSEFDTHTTLSRLRRCFSGAPLRRSASLRQRSNSASSFALIRARGRAGVSSALMQLNLHSRGVRLSPRSGRGWRSAGRERSTPGSRNLAGAPGSRKRVVRYPSRLHRRGLNGILAAPGTAPGVVLGVVLVLARIRGLVAPARSRVRGKCRAKPRKLSQALRCTRPRS